MFWGADRGSPKKVKLDGFTASPPGFDPAGATMNDTAITAESCSGPTVATICAEYVPTGRLDGSAEIVSVAGVVPWMRLTDNQPAGALPYRIERSKSEFGP